MFEYDDDGPPGPPAALGVEVAASVIGSPPPAGINTEDARKSMEDATLAFEAMRSTTNTNSLQSRMTTVNSLVSCLQDTTSTAAARAAGDAGLGEAVDTLELLVSHFKPLNDATGATEARQKNGGALVALFYTLAQSGRTYALLSVIQFWATSRLRPKRCRPEVSRLKSILSQTLPFMIQGVAVKKDVCDNVFEESFLKRLYGFVESSQSSARTGSTAAEPARNLTTMIDEDELTGLCTSLDRKYRRVRFSGHDGDTHARRKLAFLRLYVTLQASIGCRPGDLRGAEVADLADLHIKPHAAGNRSGFYISANVVYTKTGVQERFKNGCAWLFADLNCPARCPLVAVAVALSEMDPTAEFSLSTHFLDAAHHGWAGKPLYSDASNRASHLWKSAVGDLDWGDYMKEKTSWNSLRKYLLTTVGGRALFCNIQLYLALRAGHAETKTLAGLTNSVGNYTGNTPLSMHYVGMLCAARHPLAPAGHPLAEMLLHSHAELVRRVAKENFPPNVRAGMGLEALLPYAAILMVAGLDIHRRLRRYRAMRKMARKRMPLPDFRASYADNLAAGLIEPLVYDRGSRSIVRSQRLIVAQDTEQVLKYSMGGDGDSASDSGSDSGSDDGSDDNSEGDSDSASDSDSDDDTEVTNGPLAPPPPPPRSTPGTRWAAEVLGDPTLDMAAEERTMTSLSAGLRIPGNINLFGKVSKAISQWEEGPGGEFGRVLPLKDWPQDLLALTIKAKNARRGKTAGEPSAAEFRNIHFSLAQTHANRRNVAEAVYTNYGQDVRAACDAASAEGVTSINNFIKSVCKRK